MVERIKRDTNTDLMNGIYESVKGSGEYDKAQQIMDYFLPESYRVQELSNYEFDFIAKVSFGGSEGIYIDCYIEGCFDEKVDTPQRLHCGTFKTLADNLSAMKIMGELAGTLTYYADEYLNRELDRYTPTYQREAEARRKAEKGKTL
ncbi:MAG: hypothetical protein PHI41_08585 [Erysipelotrichaceae bacterium]|nr:hypothetical protein [Erysipelotrichaceae bacterium]